MKNLIITIDGPAASGKGKISKYISKKWKFKHLDSGTLYRHLAFKIIENKIDLNSEVMLRDFIIKQKKISYKKYKKLRSEKISKAASKIAIYGFVRDYINKFQRNYVKSYLKKRKFVIDGRDIGSVVFKNANLKLYIDVNEQNRAKRRYKQLIDSGEKSIYRQILKEIKLRDTKDKNRKVSPLIVPRDAYIINNNGTFKETAKQISRYINKL